jgi:hypothetical protein
MSNIATTCTTCGARYGGRAGHCSACHRTFSSDSGFDRHLISRVTAGCHDPATVMTKGDDPRPVFEWDGARQLWKLAGPAEAARWWQAAEVPA